MDGRRRVVVLGDAVVDVLVRGDAPLARATDAPRTVRLHGGGAAANAAAWFARAGAEAHLVARVGDDPWGRALGDDLASAGVVPHLAVDAEARTGAVVVVVGEDRERSFLADRGAAAHLAPSDVPLDLLGAGTHLHVSGYALLGTGSREAARSALAAAARAGATTSVDPASAAPLAVAGAAAFLTWVRGTRWCTPNRDEAAVLTGEADPRQGARALASAVDEAVVTCGADGAVWSDGDAVVEVAAVPAEVVDATGAGDAFVAGFVLARLDGGAPADALAAGAALAARAVTGEGGR